MLNSELLCDRMARASLQRRRDRETERQERIFNDKVRTIGVDKDALDMQVEEKKKREEAEKEKQKARDAEMHHNSKVASILHNREMKQKRDLEKAIVNYRQQFQQPWSQREYDLNDPKTNNDAAQMTVTGLVGEDSESKTRLQRQREQLREWLFQQQSEQAAERHQQKLEEQHYDQSRVEVDNKALHLQSLEAERRKAEATATKEFNQAKAEERRHREQERKRAEKSNQLQGQLNGVDVNATVDMVGVPTLFPSSERRAPLESPQEVMQAHKYQIEDRKRIELEKKQEEELLDHVRLTSARTALLFERQQAKLKKQLRRHLDSINVKLAETQKQQKPDIERGCIDDSFFSKHLLQQAEDGTGLDEVSGLEEVHGRREVWLHHLLLFHFKQQRVQPLLSISQHHLPTCLHGGLQLYEGLSLSRV
ncbi:hypothetical protein INR49_005215, partial [Caranx melampygus]